MSSDVRNAYRRLRRKALALGSISSAFHRIALDVTAAYHVALTQSDPHAWERLVMRAAALIESTHALPQAFVLDAPERDALAYFEAIVRENVDLLAASPAPRRRLYGVQRTHHLDRRNLERRSFRSAPTRDAFAEHATIAWPRRCVAGRRSERQPAG